MKKHLILILTTVISAYSFGQNPIEVIVKGTIANDTIHSFTLGDSVLKLSDSGTYIYKCAVSKPQFISAKYFRNQFQIFIEPNETLELSFDARDIDKSIAFKGVSPETNKFLFNQNKTDEQVGNYFNTSTLEWKNLCNKNEVAFLEEIDSLKNLYLKPLYDLMSSSKKVDPKFLFVERSRVDFLFNWLILEYPNFHKNYDGTETVLSKKTQTYLNAFDLDNPKFLDIEGYVAFGKEIIQIKIREEFRANKELNKSDHQLLVASFNVINRIFKNKEVNEFWQYQYLTSYMGMDGIKNIAPFIDEFNQTCHSGKLKKRLNSIYQEELNNQKGHLIKAYKTVGGFSLDAHIFIPKELKKDELRPAIVSFSGGSWSEGKPDWDFGYSDYGFINVCIEYRTYDRYGVMPFEEISDVKSAIRWLRQNADELHIDKNKIIAEGTSAGGHLALSTALLDILDEPSDDLTISSKPNALILVSAVYDLTEVWFERFVRDKQTIKDICPTDNIKKGLPPMLIFHGTADTESAPYSTCIDFIEKMKLAGNDTYFYPIQNVGHALWRNGLYYQISGKARSDFFKKIGYL